MNIIIARHAGFCFGVKRATDAAEAALSGGGRICTLGRLIHNDGYTKSLRERGVEEIGTGDIDGIAADAAKGEKITVIIRAHGEIRENLEKLQALRDKYENFTLLDCTCPYVNKVRRIAAENSGEGKLFILIGSKEHPEVRGIMSCCSSGGMVFANAGELEAFLNGGNAPKAGSVKVSIAAQTTQKLSEWKKCLKILKKLYTNVKSTRFLVLFYYLISSINFSIFCIKSIFSNSLGPSTYILIIGSVPLGLTTIRAFGLSI